MKHSILWITPKWPLPAHDGARIATTQLIKNVAKLGITIDLLSIVDRETNIDLSFAQKELKVRRVFPIERKETPTGNRKVFKLLMNLIFSPLHPLTLGPYCETKVKEAFQSIWREFYPDWDSILFDGMHAAAICSDGKTFNPPSEFPKIIYRAHNVETDLWSQASFYTRLRPKRWVMKLQTAHVKRFERSLLRQSDIVATVSKEDLLKLRILEPNIKGDSIPIGMETPKLPSLRSSQGGPLRLLFLGRLDWPPNRDGLIWFLKQVWPTLSEKRPHLSLIIAGKGDGGWLKDYGRLPNLDFLGAVQSTAPLYENCDLSIVPIFYGSGTRVKVIESSLHRKACLSTALGVEGTGLISGKTYIRAEAREEWIHALSLLNGADAEEMGLRAFASVSKTFCPEASARKLVTLLQGAGP